VSGSGDRLRRFERLERPRREGPDGDERPSAAERIEGVEGERERERAGGPAPAVPASSRERFAPPRERTPDVQEPAGEEQPFIRCRRCEMDNSRFARRCANCGEDLATEEQRAFNARLWEERRRERDELDRENAERRAAQAQAEAEAARDRRQAAEEMARQVGERERERLSAGGLGGGWGQGQEPYGAPSDPAPVGVRLLRLIPSPLWRLAAIGALVLAVVLGLALARANPVALVLVFSLLVGLFTPRRRWSRRRWW
jgi:hypothetical protein